MAEAEAGEDRELSSQVEVIDSILKEAYQLHSSNPAGMLSLLEKASSLIEQGGHTGLQSKCNNIFSIYYGVTGDYHRALQYALEVVRSEKEDPSSETLSVRYANISILYGRLSEFENAVRYAEMAVEEAKKGDNSHRLALAINNLGVACENASDPDKALSCFLESARILGETGPVEQYAMTLVNIGRQYCIRNRAEEAEKYMKMALDAAEENGLDFASAAASLELAKLYAGQSRDSFRIRGLLENAMARARAIDDKDFLSRTCETMADCLEQTGDFAGALKAHREYTALREEVLGYEKMLAVAKLEKEFEFLQKEKEAEIYRLKNVELVRARDAAEAADRAKSDFLAMMSHEIRTPMNVVMGMVEMALRSGPDPEIENYLKKSNVASRSLLDLINDILDYSRIEAGKIEFESIPFSPGELLGETASIFEQTARDKMLELRVSSSGLPELVRGDPGRLGQVLRNLLSNALKFTENGYVELAGCAEENDVLTFTVTDTGPGIPPEKQSELFRPFVQASSSIARTHGGSGLGLAICSRLMEGMGGSISVESAQGKGSAFTVSATFQGVAGGASTELDQFDSPRNIHGITVMVVEDMETGREVARLFLESLGARVLEAESGFKALELLEDHTPDIILMDLQMPGIDGIETTERIRSGGFEMPIIAATAHAMSSHREMCLASGMNDVVTKPFSIDELKKVLSRWV